MKVFLVRVEYTYDYVTTIEEELFDSYEKAKKIFDECVKAERENSHLIRREKCKIEQSEYFFTIYEDGRYCQDHYSIDIFEKEVK